MKILITGNTGYIGPVLVRHLRTVLPKTTLIGYDSGFFAHCLTNVAQLPEVGVALQYFGDVRSLPAELLDGVDAVVALAAVSNDPMGGRFEGVTDAINHRSVVEIARLAARRGVKHFAFASSCSMYGAAEGGPRRENDPLNPLTAYARSKVAAEQGLAAIDPGGMIVTSLRFSTACGMSDRIRLDLVLNDFVACAIASGEITVLSDGSPWRPLIDVKDMARAIEWAITRERDHGGQVLAVNVGTNASNRQVADLANTVAAIVPGTKVSINTAAPPDKRSYQVDFRLFAQLAPNHLPLVSLEQSVAEIHAGLRGAMFSDGNFRNSQYMRLKVLEKHIGDGRLSEDLRWLNYTGKVAG
jgi:nucleoside-diphosphate-sugar epimerase